MAQALQNGRPKLHERPAQQIHYTTRRSVPERQRPCASAAQEKAMHNMFVSWGFSGINDFDNLVTLTPERKYKIYVALLEYNRVKPGNIWRRFQRDGETEMEQKNKIQNSFYRPRPSWQNCGM